MSVRVEVVVPWRPGCRYREAAWRWLRGRYRWPITAAEPPAGAWCKAAAVTPAISRSCADVVIVADADCWTDGLPDAVDAVLDGAPWAIPHFLVHRLTRQATEQLRAGADPHGLPVEQKPYGGVECGGYIIARRDVLVDVPMDPRFQGWGQEDESWAFALRTLVGAPWRGQADLWHLWHPPQPRETRRHGSQDGWNLYRRYLRANRNPDRMRDLIGEVVTG